MSLIPHLQRMLGLAGVLTAAATLHAADPEEVFTRPPLDAKPGVWWHWMGCNVSKEGITKDLEALHDAGFGMATLFGMADVCTPWAGHIENSPGDGLIAFTAPWWEMVRHAAAEGRRLGIDVGMHNCPGYTHSGGPWIPPELSMLELATAKVSVEGGREVTVEVPRPQVDPRANMHFPVHNKDTGVLEKPVIEARKTFYRDIALLALPASGTVAPEQVVNLTGRLGADGRLTWAAPAGAWEIVRVGYTTMGSLTQPNQWEAMGLECDKMNPEAMKFHLDHIIGEMRKHLGDLVGTGLRHVLFDSYEAGTPSWTPKMAEEFKARRGYDLTPFLATFAGRTIGGDAETKKFKGDFDRTIHDLYRDVHFAMTSKRFAEIGVRFVCEPYGGPFSTAEAAPHVARVMTEFWSGGEFHGGVGAAFFKGPNGTRHNILEAEAFTGAPETSMWVEHPGGLKAVGDGAFLGGINRLVLHTSPLQAWDDRYRPGQTMGRWGTHFGRFQTWFEPGKAWVAYLSRCQALLQWGTPGRGNMISDATLSGQPVRSLRRSSSEADVFFVVNPRHDADTARCVFPVTGKQPELWCPVTGIRRDLTVFTSGEGGTVLNLQFAPRQAWFVVFRKPAVVAAAAAANFPALAPVLTLEGPWEVRFDPAWGGPASVQFDSLQDWTRRPEPGIKYYSGTATYRKTFAAAGAAARMSLDLGAVPHLARVRINGTDLGVVWTPPFRVSIPAGLLKPAGNLLEIDVTNVWANRLIGDEQEPDDCEWVKAPLPGGSYLKRFPDWFVKKEPRPSKGRFAFTTWNYFTKDSALASSGLLGPVVLMKEDWSSSAADPFAHLPPARSAGGPGGSPAAFEASIPRQDVVPLAAIDEEGALPHTGGGDSPAALHNGTTFNGGGGEETADDGETFRGYGKGSVVTLRLDLKASPRGYDLAALHTFAGHNDARASQAYDILVSRVDDPARYIPAGTVSSRADGGATYARTPLDVKNAAAVRLVFKDGPVGFNVMRELVVTGKPAGR